MAKHVCGLQGFMRGGIDSWNDSCPACDEMFENFVAKQEAVKQTTARVDVNRISAKLDGESHLSNEPAPHETWDANIQQLNRDFAAALSDIAYDDKLFQRFNDIRLRMLAAVVPLENDKRRLDWLEREAGRVLHVRDEADPEICNIYLRVPGDPLGGGVLASLRDAADKGLLREPQ